MKKLLSFLSAISLVGTASTSSVACLKKEVREPSNDAEAFANQILNRSIELVSVGFIDGNSSDSNTMREALLYGLFLANRGLEAQVQQDNITLTFARGVNISRQRGINTEIDLTITSGDDGSSTTLTMSAGLPISTFIDQQFIGLIVNKIDNAEIEITQELTSPDLSDPATRTAVLNELTSAENLTPLQSRAIQISTNQGALNKQGFNVDVTANSGGQTEGATVLVKYDIVKIIAQKITNRSIALPESPTMPTINDATKMAIKTKLQENNPSLSQTDLDRINIVDTSSTLNLGGATFVSWSITDGEGQPEIQPEQLTVSVAPQPISATFYSYPTPTGLFTINEGQTVIFNNRLWYATNQGLQYFNGNQLTTFTQGGLSVSDNILRLVTTTGHLWVVAKDAGVDKAYAIAVGQSGYTVIELQLGTSNTIDGMVVAQTTSTVYISNESSGLYKFAFDDPNDGQLIAPPPSWSNNEFIVGLHITTAASGDPQYVLAYTDFGKMYRLIDDPTDTVTEINLQPTSGPVISRGPFVTLISRGNTFFLGLVNGIIRVTNFTANIRAVEAYGNADGRITKIVPDSSGNLWIISNGDLRLLRSGGTSIETLPNSPTDVADITSSDALQSVFITAGPQNNYSLQRWSVDGQISLDNIANLDTTFTSTNIAAFGPPNTPRRSLLASGTKDRLQRVIFSPWNATANVDSVNQAINFFYQPAPGSQGTVYGFTANGVYVINF